MRMRSEEPGKKYKEERRERRRNKEEGNKGRNEGKEGRGEQRKKGGERGCFEGQGRKEKRNNYGYEREKKEEN